MDICANFGVAGDKPVVMRRYDHDIIGVFHGNGTWQIDQNGDFDWDGCAEDRCNQFGQTGDIPIARCGSLLGVFRNGQWIIDQGGNAQFDGCGTDDCFTFGKAGDVPLMAGCTIGYYRNGTAYFDFDGDRKITDCNTDGCMNLGGLSGQQPGRPSQLVR